MTSAVFTLFFTGCDDSGVEPPGPVSSLEIRLESDEVSATSTQTYLYIETEMDWTVTVSTVSPGFDSEWVNVPKTRGTGHETLKITFAANAEYDRAARIKVEVTGMEKEVRLTQLGNLGSRVFPKWTELPEIELDGNTLFYTHYCDLNGETIRNYSLFYDKTTYISYWVAYPMHSSYMGTGRTDRWGYDPKIPREHQINYSSGYGSNNYDRGHQIASADRNATVNRNNPADMNVQTFYYTNITPQRWRLNQQKWESLEGFLRGKVSGNADTMWVVTGAMLHKAGVQEEVRYLSKATGAGVTVDVPVPNYYYKVALWHRTVPGGKEYTAVGFWMPNEDATGSISRSDAYTVREIEELTGFDFFSNIPKDEQDRFETVVGSGWF